MAVFECSGCGNPLVTYRYFMQPTTREQALESTFDFTCTECRSKQSQPGDQAKGLLLVPWNVETH